MCLIILSFGTKAEEISFADGVPTDWKKAGTTASVTRVNKKCLQLQKGASITSPVYNNVSEINVELNISNLSFASNDFLRQRHKKTTWILA